MHKPYRKFSETNINHFNQILSEVDYSPVYAENCPDKAYNSFTDIFRNKYNEAFPIIYEKPPRKFFKRSPWLTKGLLQSTISKSKLLKIKLKNPTLL